MKKIITSSFLILIGFVLLATSLIVVTSSPKAHADAPCQETSDGQYCLLEPIPLGGGTTFSEYDPDTTTAASYINIIIKVFISIIGGLGVVMIVLGGVQYMTTDAISKKEGGKEMITNSILGLVLALASWLILNAINPNLNVINLNPPQTQSLTVGGTDAPPASSQNATPGAQVCSQSPTINGNPILQGAVWSNGIGEDSTNRSALTSAGVTINANNCSNVGDSGCTSVAGYSLAQIAEIIALHDAVCGGSGNTCTFELTGGTECWLHSTHGPDLGNAIADFSADSPINTFVTGGSTFPTTAVTISKSFTGGSASFLAEQPGQTQNTTASHWHVNFQ